MLETDIKSPLPYDTVALTWAPDGKELVLQKRAECFYIFVDGVLLMSSRYHETEEALGRLGCAHIASTPEASVLIGGFGMGYTLRATLDSVPKDARITVAEIVEDVVAWNSVGGELAELAGEPILDPRTGIVQEDVGAVVRSAREHTYDAILIDTDNEPRALSYVGNDSLYSVEGLSSAWRALRPGGVLAFWFLQAGDEFLTRLSHVGFRTGRHEIASGEGPKNHIVVVANK